MWPEVTDILVSLPWFAAFLLYGHHVFRKMRPCRAPLIRKGTILYVPRAAVDPADLATAMRRASVIPMTEERTNRV